MLSFRWLLMTDTLRRGLVRNTLKILSNFHIIKNTERMHIQSGDDVRSWFWALYSVYFSVLRLTAPYFRSAGPGDSEELLTATASSLSHVNEWWKRAVLYIIGANLRLCYRSAITDIQSQMSDLWELKAVLVMQFWAIQIRSIICCSWCESLISVYDVPRRPIRPWSIFCRSLLFLFRWLALWTTLDIGAWPSNYPASIATEINALLWWNLEFPVLMHLDKFEVVACLKIQWKNCRNGRFDFKGSVSAFVQLLFGIPRVSPDFQPWLVPMWCIALWHFIVLSIVTRDSTYHPSTLLCKVTSSISVSLILIPLFDLIGMLFLSPGHITQIAELSFMGLRATLINLVHCFLSVTCIPMYHITYSFIPLSLIIEFNMAGMWLFSILQF